MERPMILTLVAGIALGSGFTASAMEQNNEDLNKQLIRAADRGNLDNAKELIEVGADVNAKDNKGRTVLMHAVLREDRAVVKYLVTCGADVYLKDNNGKTALMWMGVRAAANGDKIKAKLVAEYLVERMLRLTQVQKKEVYTLLLCLKHQDKNILNKDTPRPIAQHLCGLYTSENNVKTFEEIGKISSPEIKQALLEKYFPEEQNN